MGSRKEQLKKALGISEYPWSSDDEDQPMPDVHLLRRQSGDPRPSVADIPGTSGQQLSESPVLSPPKRDHAEMLWSIMNAAIKPPPPQPPTSSGASRTLRACEGSPTNTPPPEIRTDRMTAAADIPRILAFRKITQCRLNNSMRSSKSSSNLYSPHSRGLSGPARSSLLSPFLSHQNTLKRLQSSRSPFTRNCGNSSPVGRIPCMGMFEFPRINRRMPSPTSNQMIPLSPPAEPDPPFADNSTRPIRSENTAADQGAVADENSTQNTTQNTTGMSLEEEIVEIDTQDEPDGNTTAAESNTPNAVVNADVELNQVITVDANEEPRRSQQERRRDGSASVEEAEPSSVKEFNQNLLRLLECPVCLEWMEPPMSQCRRGHLVCGRCRARLSSCPVCRTTFSSVRNRAMEGVAEMVRYPCRHMCGREVRLRRRNSHEASCGARRYACPAPACADRPPLPRDQLAQHLQSKHMPMLKIGRKHKFSMKVNSEQHDTWVIAALHEYFSLRVDVDIRTWGVIVYVTYIGPKCNAKNFIYEVSVIGQHNSRKLVYARATHSDLESTSLNVSRQDCFHLTIDQALNFLRVKNRHCEPDKFLDFNVEITKTEAETRDDSDS